MLGTVGATAICAALAPVARKIVRMLTSKLEKSVDADRVTEELEGMVLDLRPAERAKFTIELVVDQSRLCKEIEQYADLRRALVQQIRHAMEVVQYWDKVRHNGTSKLEVKFRSIPAYIETPEATVDQLLV